MFETMKAAIFDMDGTLIDSMPSWRRLNSDFVREQGIVPTTEQEAAMYAMSGTMVVSYYKAHFGLNCDFDALCTMACTRMEDVYRAGVPLKPGAAAYLDRLHARGVLCVLATATPSRQALIALNHMGLTSRLDYIYSTEMLGIGKSETAFYERVSAEIGIPRTQCVMFEDALYAAQGARRAGLLGVVGIEDSTNVPEQAQMRAVCDTFITSYDELP